MLLQSAAPTMGSLNIASLEAQVREVSLNVGRTVSRGRALECGAERLESSVSADLYVSANDASSGLAKLDKSIKKLSQSKKEKTRSKNLVKCQANVKTVEQMFQQLSEQARALFVKAVEVHLQFLVG